MTHQCALYQADRASRLNEVTSSIKSGDRRPQVARRTTDCRVWFVTEKDLRTTGTASMKAAATDLRQTATELEKAARRPGCDRPASSNGSGATPPEVFGRMTVRGQAQKQHQAARLP